MSGMEEAKRIVFLDYLRVVAIFMVLLVHACEQFYFGSDGGFFIASASDAAWVVGIDSACRASVPLFVMASAYLLFPLSRPADEFLMRRLVRVGVPFALWAIVYNAWNGGSWAQMLFNFPMATGGHLWFVPMLFGVYLLMPLLSPWAERATAREVRGWIALWLVTTLFPFFRLAWGAAFGDGWSHAFGSAAFEKIPFLFGECPWNSFGTFHYVSGFFGYLLLGFYFRRFAPGLSWRRTLGLAAPLALVGWLVVAGFFYFRIARYGGTYPVSAPYSAAVELETSWEFCSFGVVLTTAAFFLVARKLTADGVLHRRVIRPLAEASYGVYLVHILVLCPVVALLRPHLPTPAVIVLSAVSTFIVSSLVCGLGRRIPRLGPLVFG